MISYDKLFKLLIDKKLNKTQFALLCGISTATLSKLSKGETITTETINKICKGLDCNVDDIMEYKEKQ